MKVIVTAEELIDKWLWDDFCEERGINVWAVNEGLMDSEHEFELSEEEARKYGFLKSDEDSYHW